MENLVTRKNLETFYSGKKIFLTGHTGFKGSWLMTWLDMWGAQVKGYALQPEYSGSLYEQMLHFTSVDSVIGDIRDREKLLEEIKSFEPDLIFHLAAQPLVRRSYRIPSETFEVNAVGTANLLEAVMTLPKKCSVIVITTDKVYENKEKHILYKEDDMLGGYDPYSASKACTELVVSSFRNSFFHISQHDTHQKAIASVRAGNVIGGGDFSEDRIIPDIIQSLQAGKTIEVRNPTAVRPWQHVLEPLSGYLLLGTLLHEQPQNFSGAYNFGPEPEDHLTVKELVTQAIESWGAGNWKDTSDTKQPHEAGLLMLDINKAKQMLEWYPKLNAKEAIQWTIGWYKIPQDQQIQETKLQIERYCTL
jgi:CDP-glucose 4,6-dehydratase